MKFNFTQADPAQALNVPVVPLGAMLSAAYPLSSRPPYVLSWLTDLISAQDMMHPELLQKLVLNNFCELSFIRSCITFCTLYASNSDIRTRYLPDSTLVELLLWIIRIIMIFYL